MFYFYRVPLDGAKNKRSDGSKLLDLKLVRELSEFKSWEAPENLDTKWISLYRNASYLLGIDYILKINVTGYSSPVEELKSVFDDPNEVRIETG